MSMDDLLPPGIWYRILTKLPVKSILRCTSVCKTWYSLIASSDFITYHAAQTLNHGTSNRVLVQHCDPIKGIKKFSSHDESFVESREHDDLPEQLGSGIVNIVGSCDGLVCLLKIDELETDDDYIEVHSFLIWNPCIRKLVQLPFRPLPPPEPYEDDNTRYLLGFGFDSVSGDYKILRVGYLISYGPRYGAPFVSEIFDLRKGVWRAISPPTTPYYVEDPETCVYLHDCLHWIGYEHKRNYVLVFFNLSTEVSQEMVMPGGEEFKDVKDSDLCYVLANKGMLSVALLRKQLQYDADQICCTVWSMKEYGVTESWTKLFNIELPYKLNHLGLLRFWENGEVVIAGREGDNALVLYNPENMTSEALFSVSPDEVDEYILDVCFYKESLALL